MCLFKKKDKNKPQRTKVVWKGKKETKEQRERRLRSLRELSKRDWE